MRTPSTPKDVLGRPSPRGRAAFTLIELLVVLGIVMVLAVIALPVVSQAREAARSVVCLSNLRQIGVGALAYAAKYDGYTVPGYADDKVKPTKYKGYVDAENYATMLVNEEMVKAPQLSGLDEAISAEASIFRCPNGSDDLQWTEFSSANATAPYPKGRQDPLGGRPQRTLSRKSKRVVDTWYGINAALDRFGSAKAPCRRIPDDDTIPLGRPLWNWSLPRLREMHDPSRMVFLFDGVFMNLHREPDRLQARHGRRDRTNLLFFDGHSESVQTATLPGGLGPNNENAGVDRFASVEPNSPVLWRMDQR